MAEPVRKTPHAESEEQDVILLERWVERPGGRGEFLHKPLAPEDYLNPLFGDKWLQGQAHGDLLVELTELLKRHFWPQQDVLVPMEVQHRFGPGFPKPAPDISVIRGVRDCGGDRSSFDVRKEDVVPSLILEVISRRGGEIRRTDEETKVRLYERAGIPEYLLVYPPNVTADHRFQLAGLRLGLDRRYHPIEPDKEACLFSETTGLRFGISDAGNRIEVFDARTGERIPTPLEIEEARRMAEEELKRLRAEIERLKTFGR